MRRRGLPAALRGQTIDQPHDGDVSEAVADPFLIWTSPRTGSTVFWRDLDTHPQIEAHGEVLLENNWKPDSFLTFRERNPERGQDVGEFLDQLLSAGEERVAVGFKMMYRHRSPAFDAWFAARPRLRVVHLVRSNALRQHVSLLAARQRGVFHVMPGEPRPRKRVTVPLQNLRNRLARLTGDVAMARTFIADHDHIEIRYEDLVTARGAVYERIFAFLGVPGIELAEPTLRRINLGALPELIENYAQVVEVLQGTEYERFLK